MFVWRQTGRQILNLFYSSLKTGSALVFNDFFNGKDQA
jgi:hypothetical protein